MSNYKATLKIYQTEDEPLLVRTSIEFEPELDMEMNVKDLPAAYLTMINIYNKILAPLQSTTMEIDEAEATTAVKH